jgi:hypothetical protein
MTTDQHRNHTKHEELGDLRRNTAQAAAEGELSRAERIAYEEAVRARAIELYCAGLVDEAKALIKRELGK